MSARAALRVVLLGTVALGLLPPATASATSTASCWHRWTDDLYPGVSLTRHKSEFTSHGERGSIDCTGSVRGHKVTGRGSFGEEGVYDGSCAFGSGAATFSFTIPTTAGPEKFRMPVTFTFAGFGYAATKDFPGSFGFIPITGDCVRRPVTKVLLVRFGTLKT